GRVRELDEGAHPAHEEAARARSRAAGTDVAVRAPRGLPAGSRRSDGLTRTPAASRILRGWEPSLPVSRRRAEGRGWIGRSPHEFFLTAPIDTEHGRG